MEKRKSISQSLRFEVFKRDSFKCQYCGKSAPDVILECDHIIPVVEGGKNEMINLVTACMSCNRGKGKRLLSDRQTISKQQKQMEDMNAAKEQTDMLIQWKKELMSLLETQVDAIEDVSLCVSSIGLSETGRLSASKLIRRFGFEEVFAATQIALDRYFNGSDRSWEIAFSKIGGVCYNRKHGRTWDGE